MKKQRQISRDGEEGEHLSWDLILGFGYLEIDETCGCYFQNRVSKTKTMIIKQKVFTRKASEIKPDRN